MEGIVGCHQPSARVGPTLDCDDSYIHGCCKTENEQAGTPQKHFCGAGTSFKCSQNVDGQSARLQFDDVFRLEQNQRRVSHSGSVTAGCRTVGRDDPL